MDVEDDNPKNLESREPTLEDLVELCRHLNGAGARYIVIGGFAMRAAGYSRQTMDIDLLVDVEGDNENRILSALEYLPDQAVKDIACGELKQYTVIRVADEIVVDLMVEACGMNYQQSEYGIVRYEIENVSIPFASPDLLRRLKSQTHREKDILDLFFLSRLEKSD